MTGSWYEAEEWLGECPHCGSANTTLITQNYETFAKCNDCGERKFMGG